MIYSVPVLALMLAWRLGKGARAFTSALGVAVFLGLLLLLERRVIFITEPGIVPIAYCLLYFSLWYGSLVIPFKPPRLLLIAALTAMHGLLMFGFMLLIWILGDSLEKSQLRFQIGPIRVYTRTWGNISHSGIDYIFTKKIPGFGIIEKRVYYDHCGDANPDCLQNYLVSEAGSGYEIKLMFKQGRSVSIAE